MEWTAETKKSLASRLRALKPFDPYNSPLCTCGPKLTLNVYTGCGSECLYCYASSYAHGRWGRNAVWGPRVNLLENLERDIRRINESPELAPLRNVPVALSLSSDPYPDTPHVSEEKLGLTRSCLRMLSEAGFLILIQTKSDLIVRDLDVLQPRRTVIGLTITTLNDSIARKLEPHAPPPARRVKALAAAKEARFSTLCRIDPIIPGLNDSPESLEPLIAALAAAGVNQVVSSTLKLRRDCSARFARGFPAVAAQADSMYQPADKSGYRYLQRGERRRRLELVKTLAHSHGLSFACCREGMPELSDTHCDGRCLISTED